MWCEFHVPIHARLSSGCWLLFLLVLVVRSTGRLYILSFPAAQMQEVQILIAANSGFLEPGPDGISCGIPGWVSFYIYQDKMFHQYLGILNRMSWDISCFKCQDGIGDIRMKKIRSLVSRDFKKFGITIM